MSGGSSRPSARLPPPSGRLLPPSQALLPPQLTGEAARAPQPDGAGGQEEALRRARERVVVLGQRARETAAAHAPELKRQARVAAGVASVQAARAAREAALRTGGAARAAQAAWVASAAVPGRRRLWLLGGGGALAVLAVLLWVTAQQHATAVARVRLAEVLDRTGLRGVVLYRALSASPSGTVTLRDVTLRLDPLLVPIDTVTLSGVVDGPNGPTAGTIALQGAVAPVAPVARSGVLGQWPAALLGLGITTARLDGSVRFSTDDAAETLSASASLSAAGVGRAEATIELGGLDSQRLGRVIRLVRTLQAGQAGGYGDDPEGASRELQALLASLSWQGGTLTLNDAPLRARAREVTALSVPDEAGRPGLIGPTRRLPADAFAAVLPPDQAEAGQASVQSWLDGGGRLVIRSEPRTPIGLFHRRGYGNELAPALDEATLAAAGLSISN